MERNENWSSHMSLSHFWVLLLSEFVLRVNVNGRCAQDIFAQLSSYAAKVCALAHTRAFMAILVIFKCISWVYFYSHGHTNVNENLLTKCPKKCEKKHLKLIPPVTGAFSCTYTQFWPSYASVFIDSCSFWHLGFWSTSWKQSGSRHCSLMQ